MPDAARDAPILFLSHAGVDTAAARRLKERIEQAPEARKHGLRVWFDKDDLRAGESWQAQLEDAIGRRATAFAVYVGSRGVVNWVEAEVRLGLSRAISGNGHRFPFIPIFADRVVDPEVLPSFARQFQGVRDVETNPDEFQKLVGAVLGDTKVGTLELEFGALLRAQGHRRNPKPPFFRPRARNTGIDRAPLGNVLFDGHWR